MFTHQLIWTLRTEIIDHKNLTEEEKEEIKPAEEVISEISHRLYLQVLGELVYDERAKKLYEEEFSFFDQITEISGALVPYPKEER
jgi:phosphatidylinositol 4-kinase